MEVVFPRDKDEEDQEIIYSHLENARMHLEQALRLTIPKGAWSCILASAKDNIELISVPLGKVVMKRIETRIPSLILTQDEAAKWRGQDVANVANTMKDRMLLRGLGDSSLRGDDRL